MKMSTAPRRNTHFQDSRIPQFHKNRTKTWGNVGHPVPTTFLGYLGWNLPSKMEAKDIANHVQNGSKFQHPFSKAFGCPV